jgi:hypothetical protein
MARLIALTFKKKKTNLNDEIKKENECKKGCQQY